MLAAVTPFVACLLLLLSATIIKALYLVAHATSLVDASGSVWFGVWGYCISAVDVSVINVGNSAQCSKARLGYVLNRTILAALHATDLNVSRTISAVLVLYPIACGFTFLALLASFFMRPDRGPSRGAAVLTLITGPLVALNATVVFVAFVRHRVRSESDGVLTLNWGNAERDTFLIWVDLLLTLDGLIRSCLMLLPGRVYLGTTGVDRAGRDRCTVVRSCRRLRGCLCPWLEIQKGLKVLDKQQLELGYISPIAWHSYRTWSIALLEELTTPHSQLQLRHSISDVDSTRCNLCCSVLSLALSRCILVRRLREPAVMITPMNLMTFAIVRDRRGVSISAGPSYGVCTFHHTLRVCPHDEAVATLGLVQNGVPQHDTR